MTERPVKPVWELCPVCGKDLLIDRDMMDTIEMERREWCPDGHYEYDFVTGSTCERILDREWFWSYTDTLEAEQQRRKERDEYIKNVVVPQRLYLQEQKP